MAAPAGFGKTTLVASCIAGCDMPVAWLSLDKEDSQVERFLNYLIAALQQVSGSVGREAAQRLAAAGEARPEAIVTSLINDLDRASTPVALVLDDYQFIRNPAVHAAVALLLDHCPPTFHLLIATRSDPPLPLSRLRARGQMVELRRADLGFTEAEAAEFLNAVMGLHLDERAIALLQERTEGWIAGLQMAALSMRDRQGAPAFIEGFSGTNRYILDYLLEEVLASQPPQIQRFLLHTSVLERLTAPLCDALTGAEESREPDTIPGFLAFGTASSGAQSILEYLEGANLFLVPLDDARIWYRYHHLFADLLRAQLQRSLGADGVARLHIRASEWYEETGSILDAIHHAFAASDDERAEHLIEQHYMEMVIRGEMSAMRYWAGRLRRDQVYGRPWLCIYEAHSHAWFGEMDEADRLLEEAEKRIRAEITAPDAQSMLGHLAYVKSRITAMRGDIPRAIELCLEARQNVPAGNLALHSDIGITLGYEYYCTGQYGHAREMLEETIRSGIAHQAVTNPVAASCVLARLVATQGRLRQSYDTYQNAAQRVAGAPGQHFGLEAVIKVGVAELLREWNDLDGALTHIEQGVALMSWWGKADDVALAHVTLARIHLAQGNGNDAAEAVAKALQVLETSSVFSEARRAVEGAQVKLWLAQGNLEAASRWAASVEVRPGSDDRVEYESEPVHIARARVWIAQRAPAEAIALLAPLEETARSRGRMGRVVEILILKALAMQGIDNLAQADAALAESLALAEPEGYARVFLDEGRPMQALLARWAARAGPGPVREYATHLLAQFETEPPLPAAAQQTAPPAAREQALVEPLSPRELEVLHHIALGRTNKEIAQELIVAPGTIKAHTSSIYRKLDVANRTEAVARARQLDLLA